MVREAVRVILVKEDQLLVMSRNKFGRKYSTLIGGGVDPGETREAALIREVKEECGLNISEPRLVYIEQAPKPFGTQYIYWCAYPGGDIALSPDSMEAKINELNQNLYEPVWLPLSDLPKTPFLSTELKQHLIENLAHGFGSQPVTFSSSAEYESQESIDRTTNGQ